MSKNFAPSINIDGETYTPKGYVWIMGLALSGCQWAIDKANNPEFLNNIRKDIIREKVINSEILIKHYGNEITDLMKFINDNSKQSGYQPTRSELDDNNPPHEDSDSK